MFDFQILSLNLIPDWVGYILFYQSIEPIAQYEKSALLLKSIIQILGIYEFVLWIIAIFGITMDIYVVQIIVIALSLYFQFQLLSNIADISVKHHSLLTSQIRMLRNIKTLCCTIAVLPIDWERYSTISFLFIVFNIFISLWLCVVLFSYAKEERK